MPNRDLTGSELKRQGQEQVATNERAAWREKALALLRDYALGHQHVTGDAYHRYCDSCNLGQPHHANVWGTLFTTAHQRGWIKPTEKHTVSNRKEARRHHYAIWLSLLWEGPGEAEVAYRAAEDTELPEGDVVKEAQAVRYEIRALGKNGKTCKSKAGAVEATKEYAEHYGIEADDVNIYVYVPVLLKK